MLVTPWGIVSVPVSAQQPKKALFPMLVTLGGIVTFARDKQFLKAASPMLVTLDGIVMLNNLHRPRKAPLPMLVTSDGIDILSPSKRA